MNPCRATDFAGVSPESVECGCSDAALHSVLRDPRREPPKSQSPAKHGMYIHEQKVGRSTVKQRAGVRYRYLIGLSAMAEWCTICSSQCGKTCLSPFMFPRGDHAWSFLRQSHVLRWHSTPPVAARPLGKRSGAMYKEVQASTCCILRKASLACRSHSGSSCAGLSCSRCSGTGRA